MMKKQINAPFFEVVDLIKAEGEVAAYGLPLITVTAKGTLLVCSNARVGDRFDAGNIQYGVLLRSTDNGETWMKKKIRFSSTRHSFRSRNGENYPLHPR